MTVATPIPTPIISPVSDDERQKFLARIEALPPFSSTQYVPPLLREERTIKLNSAQAARAEAARAEIWAVVEVTHHRPGEFIVRITSSLTFPLVMSLINP